jgi:flavin-dependent dehydrogenase
MTSASMADVVILGGWLAGAAAAIRLARLGREVLLLERAETPRWRACGVFTAAPPQAWRDLGLDAARMTDFATPIPVFRLLARGGAVVPLTYAGTRGDPGAHGLDRPRVDQALLTLAADAGASIRPGTTVTRVELTGPGRPLSTVFVRPADGAEGKVQARVVIGADGVRSAFARSLGVTERPRIGRRMAMTFHVADNRPAETPRRDGWMVLLPGGYCGLAPVPGGRVNVGIVLDTSTWAGRIRREGAAAIARRILGFLPLPGGPESVFGDAQPIDRIAGVVPVAHAVRRLAGHGGLLAGDAAGFLDPFTGEGIGRALATAELAACAADDALRGDAGAFGRYEGDVRARFAARDRLSGLVQAFLARPWLFDYAARRLATRSAVRATLDRVLGEQLPAATALDPRFLGAVLRP